MSCVQTAAIIVLLQGIATVAGQFNDYPDYFEYQRQQAQIQQFQQQQLQQQQFQQQQDFTNQQPTNVVNGGNGGTPGTAPANTATTTPGTTTTGQPPQVAQCRQNCPITSEYDPVCGTDGQSYNNRSVLRCARACGVNVRLQRIGPCAPRAL